MDGVKLFRENTLSALRDTRTEIVVLERRIESLVAGAREVELSWGQIGEALGMSRQAAWERYAATVGTERAGSVDK